jgi:hypothetical protein
MPAQNRFALAAAATVLAAAPAMGLIAAPAAGLTIAAAVADDSSTFLPFTTTLRRCDFSSLDYYDAKGDGRASAVVRAGSGQVSADVSLATAKPNTNYQVRLIQMPRESSAGCHAGSPGTAVATLRTDGAGVGAVTLSTPIMPDATGAWATIELPQPFSQLPGEFYTSDFIAAI